MIYAIHATQSRNKCVNHKIIVARFAATAHLVAVSTTPKSALYQFVAQCYRARGKTVWRDLNPHLHGTLVTGIKLHMKCRPDDIARICDDFNGGYWFYDHGGSLGESIYGAAVAAGHTKACESFEAWKKRPAYLWPEETITPERLVVGSEFTWKGHLVKVTSITSQHLIACSYEKKERDTKTEHLYDTGLNRWFDVVKRNPVKEDGTFTATLKEDAARTGQYYQWENRTPTKRFTITHAEMMAERKAFDDERRKWEKLITKAETLVELNDLAQRVKPEAGPLRHFDHDALNRALAKREKAIEKAEYESRRAEERKQWEAESQRRREKALRDYDRLLPRWRAGQDVSLPRFYEKPACLRLIGDRVEDTHGHEVNAASARKLLTFVLHHREIGWKPDPKGDEFHRPRVDLHDLKSVAADGVTVGCTHYTWEEVDRLAAQFEQANA